MCGWFGASHPSKEIEPILCAAVGLPCFPVLLLLFLALCLSSLFHAHLKAEKHQQKANQAPKGAPQKNTLQIPIRPSSQDGILGSSQCAEFASPNQQRLGDALLALEERPWNAALKLRVQQQLEDNTSCGVNSSSMKKLAEPVLLARANLFTYSIETITMRATATTRIHNQPVTEKRQNICKTGTLCYYTASVDVRYQVYKTNKSLQLNLTLHPN